MKPLTEAQQKAADLRKRAESVAHGGDAMSLESLEATSSDRAFESLHELRVHQIELEMQNDELRRAHVELDASRARYRDLYDLAPAGYCSLSPNGLILEANLTLATLLGVPRSVLQSEPITRFLFKEDQDIYYLYQRQLVEGGYPQACQLRMVRGDGTAFWAELVGRVEGSRDPDAGDPRARATCRLMVLDVSVRRHLEEENAQLETRLHRAEKLETLGVLAGGVAHDFNNLLTTILGNANLGSMSVEPDGRVAPFFAAIELAAVRAADLTRQLLAYAGKGRLVMVEADMDVITKEVVQLVSLSARPGIKLQLDLADRLPFVKGDSTQLFQVLMNLVVNATESIPEGTEGTILIRSRAEDLDETFIESTQLELPMAPGRYTTIEVIDTGCGMPPEVLARAFEPFFTTKFLGRGLGLAAMIGILQGHQGGLRVRSSPGHGSSFKIFLPAMLTARSLAVREPVATWHGEGLILVVEDDAAVRASVSAMAERLGFTSLAVSNGKEGVEAFRLHHEDLSLVLLDFAMPVMDGREALKEMRLIDPNLPIVMTSGFDAMSTGAPFEGIAGTLKKPYRIAELQGVLRRALEPETTLSA